MPLQLIDVLPQVRTEFDEASIAELAADIQARGLLQPVLLNPHLDRFTLIVGERRLRACRLAGLASIPALITKASIEDAADMQLAENIQREELALEDLAKTVRHLFNVLGSLQAVADRVKKSKPKRASSISSSKCLATLYLLTTRPTRSPMRSRPRRRLRSIIERTFASSSLPKETPRLCRGGSRSLTV